MLEGRRQIIFVSVVLLAISITMGQEYSEELQRGQSLLEAMAEKPPVSQAIFAETVAGERVIGYLFIRLEPGESNSIRSKFEAIFETPAARISGLITVVSDFTLQPKQIEMLRTVQRSDGQTMTQRRSIKADEGKLILSAGEDMLRERVEKRLPEKPFFFSVDMLNARMEIGRIKKTFALHELNPDTGETRLLVFKPDIEEDGTRVLRVLIDGTKPEAIYYFSREGTLLAWAEAGAPLLSRIVDEERGKALMKKFGRVEEPTTTAPAEITTQPQ